MAIIAATGRNCARRRASPRLGNDTVHPRIGESLAAMVCGGVYGRLRGPDQARMVRVAGADSSRAAWCRRRSECSHASWYGPNLLPSAGDSCTVVAAIYRGAAMGANRIKLCTGTRAQPPELRNGDAG